MNQRPRIFDWWKKRGQKSRDTAPLKWRGRRAWTPFAEEYQTSGLATERRRLGLKFHSLRRSANIFFIKSPEKKLSTNSRFTSVLPSRNLQELESKSIGWLRIRKWLLLINAGTEIQVSFGPEMAPTFKCWNQNLGRLRVRKWLLFLNAGTEI